MEGITALGGLDACIGWLGALALLIVGLTVVRKASSKAGLMVAAAGGVKIFVNCCAWWPTFYGQAVGYDETVNDLMAPSAAMAMFLRLLVFALIAAALFALAKEAGGTRAQGGAQPWNG